MARLMLLITSNAYKDRDGEIISLNAWREDVARKWIGGTYVGKDRLLFWHTGEPIGDIVYSDLHGRFLVEVARERQGAIKWNGVTLQISDIWDTIQRRKRAWGCSHGFRYPAAALVDDVYSDVRKWETTVLPVLRAANPFTFAGVIR